MGFRWKLIISYAAVISATLIMAMVLFSVVVNQIQQDATDRGKERLRVVTNNISARLAVSVPQGRSSLEDYKRVLSQYSELLDVRVLLIDGRGEVQADTATNPQISMEGQLLPNFKLVPRTGRAYKDVTRLRDVQYFYYARPGPDLSVPTAQTSEIRISFTPSAATQSMVQTDLWLAVPEASLSAGWDDFLRGMLLAAGLALLVSIALALLIARSISRPLLRMTRASAAIAQGNYNEKLPVKGKGNDEMERLAVSFNRMAEDVARSQQTMRDFVANVSHELKTPLTSIQGYSQAIVEGVADDPDTLQHSASVIYSEAARMRRLVDELLDLSRIESGQVELNRRELDLSKILSRVVVRLEPLANQKSLTIQHRLPEQTGVLVMGDADRLEQVFTNILDNAIKYCRLGGPVWLDIKTGPVPPSSSEAAADAGRPSRPAKICATVTVGNLGPFIPPEQIPRIFERFYKLDRSRKRQGESTGLGLAIVAELVEAHQGSLTVNSQPFQNEANLGYTIFAVHLPLLASNAAITVPQIQTVKPLG